MRVVIGIIDNINEWVGKVVCWWTLALTGIVIFEIIMRYVFNMPTIWVHEVGVYMFGTMWVLGGGVTLLKKSMVNMEVFYVRLSPRAEAIIDLCTFIFTFGFVAIVLWKSGIIGWESLLRLERSGTAWNAPYWPLRVALPTGAFLLLIQLISKFIKDLYVATGRSINER